jgi:hypothetical protein
LRQGRLVADVLVYSPQATAWSERALWETDRRVMPYGNLAKTLVANGYDFDVVNDDLLQHHATFRDGRVEINGYARRVLILPAATVMPIETLRAIRRFADCGGTVVALEALPHEAAGLRHSTENDRQLREIVAGLFDAGSSGLAGAFFLPDYQLDHTPFNPGRQPYRPTPPLSRPQRQLLAVIERATPPDFALADRAQTDGLTFIHKQVDGADVYFVTNLAPSKIATEVTFRVCGKTPQRWDAINGQIMPVRGFRSNSAGTTMALEFEPWESAFFVFTPDAAPVAPANRVASLGPLPEPLPIGGIWRMTLAGYGFERFETNVSKLASWTDAARTRHFSGKGRYETEFILPAEKLVDNTRLILDLGHVGNVADVQLNDRPVGVAWMAPHRVDITRAVHAGRNRLVVLVTNTLINYVTGLKEPPEVPLELQPRLGKANPALYESSQLAQREMHEKDLPPSGLLGPVQIVWRAAE